MGCRRRCSCLLTTKRAPGCLTRACSSGPDGASPSPGAHSTAPSITRMAVTDVTASALADVLRDRYTLERELGPVAWPRSTSRGTSSTTAQVALKVLRPELAAVLGGIGSWPRSGLTAKLQHPHILPVRLRRSRGRPAYYVMPYVAGRDPAERLAASASCRSTKRCASRPGRRARSTTRTGMASSIATSSPRTSCCTRARRW